MWQPINESRGFAARRPGEEFVDPTNPQDLATFEGMTLIPQNEPSTPTHQDFADAYAKWKKAAGKKGHVYELNSPISVIRAAMIVTLSTPRGTEHYVLFTKDNTKVEGKLNSIPPHLVPGHGGYVLNRKTSLSERAGLKPGDLLSGHRYFKPKDVAAVLDDARSTAGDEPVDQMQGYLRALAAGKGRNYVIKGGNQYASLHQKYLGEWAAPIALIKGDFDSVAQKSMLEQDMLGGGDMGKAKIQYNTSTSAALVDSLIELDGYQIAISSKAHKGGGAAASLSGIADTMRTKMHQFPASFWKNAKNRKFKTVIDTIMNASAVDGILDLAVLEEVIPSSDVAKIKKLIDDPRAPVDVTVKTKRIQAGYAANENHPNYNKGKHILAAVSRAVCNKLNQEDYTATAKSILNKANMVQMNFVTSKSGDDLVCRQFHLIWPPEFDGQVLFYADKAFSATEVKGRLGFKIKPFGPSIPEPDESLQAPSINKVELAKRKAEAAKKVGKIVTPGQRDRRDPTVGDTVALGRAKKPR